MKKASGLQVLRLEKIKRITITSWLLLYSGNLPLLQF